MKDVEHVKAVLAGKYSTARDDEIPYPPLEEVVRHTSFDHLAGRVVSEVPNGRKSREGRDYLWFKHGDKSILSHRFIVAVSLKKWPPRDFDVDHVNHDPSDNSPENLRVVTPADNAGNRREALLSELVDLEAVAAWVEAIKAPVDIEVEPEPEPEPFVRQPDMFADLRHASGIPEVWFTGETKQAEYSDGTWHKTNLGSWHLRFN